MRSSLVSSLPQGGESLLVEAEFSTWLAAASTGSASFATSTTLAAATTFSTATTSASFTSTSPWLLLAFLSLGSWFPWLPRWSALTILALTALPVWRTSFSITTPAATASTLVGEGEVDVQLLLASRSLEVDDGLLLFFVILFHILLLVSSCLFPLGVNIRSLASFPHVELGTLLLGLHGFPLVQSHLLLLLFPGSLCLQLFSGELSWSLRFLFGGSFVLALGVHGGVRLFALLGHIVLEGSPVALATASSLVLSLDSSSVVARLPVEVPLATTASFTTSTATTTTTSFAPAATSTHLSPAAATSSATVAATIVVTSVLGVALVVPLLPGLATRAGLARVHHPLPLELAVSLVLLVSFIPGVGSLLLHSRSLGHRLGRILDLLGLRDLLLGLTLLEDVQRIRVLVEEESITICHAYTVDVLHLTI